MNFWFATPPSLSHSTINDLANMVYLPKFEVFQLLKSLLQVDWGEGVAPLLSSVQTNIFSSCNRNLTLTNLLLLHRNITISKVGGSLTSLTLDRLHHLDRFDL